MNYGELDQDTGLAVVDAMSNKPALKKLDLNGAARDIIMAIFVIPNAGNIFGEDGIELLRGAMAAKGHEDVLGSMSDDELLAEEDEEEEEEEEEERGDGDESKGADGVEEKSVTATEKVSLRTKVEQMMAKRCFLSLPPCCRPMSSLKN